MTLFGSSFRTVASNSPSFVGLGTRLCLPSSSSSFSSSPYNILSSSSSFLSFPHCTLLLLVTTNSHNHVVRAISLSTRNPFKFRRRAPPSTSQSGHPPAFLPSTVTRIFTMPTTLLDLPVEILQMIGRHIHTPFRYNSSNDVMMCRGPFTLKHETRNLRDLLSFSMICKTVRWALHSLLFAGPKYVRDEVSLQKILESDCRENLQ